MRPRRTAVDDGTITDRADIVTSATDIATGPTDVREISQLLPRARSLLSARLVKFAEAPMRTPAYVATSPLNVWISDGCWKGLSARPTEKDLRCGRAHARFGRSTQLSNDGVGYRCLMAATNRLAQETSPYLRQHAENPVDWYAWGPEAFAAATERNVPILFSVGYSACHWCHVMAHECFEDDEVAGEMNRRFVNIKVDREERPDVDSIYMDAVQAMSGRGGWPMTVFLTPDGHPFYGGTYFPKPNFLKPDGGDRRRLGQPARGCAPERRGAWATRSDKRRRSSRPPICRRGDAQPGAAIVGRFVRRDVGRLRRGAEVPSTMSLDLVLRAYHRAPQDDAKTIVTTSLDAMASGGMYDHIGGGFARYSVDEQVAGPPLREDALRPGLADPCLPPRLPRPRRARWKQVVEETVEYVLRELRHPSGGFFSAEDADSPDEHGHGHEGLFHTWTTDEVRGVLGTDADIALEWYEFTDSGNFEGRTIPSRLKHRGELSFP